MNRKKIPANRKEHFFKKNLRINIFSLYLSSIVPQISIPLPPHLSIYLHTQIKCSQIKIQLYKKKNHYFS